MLVVTILLTILWVNDFIGILIICFFGPISLASIIASIGLTILSIKLKDRWQKGLFAWGIFNLLFFIAYLFIGISLQECSAQLMAEHYENNAKDIHKLIKYVDNALDDSTSFKIEFENKKAAIFHVAQKGDSLMSCHYWDDAETKKDSLMKVVGLTPYEYENIRNLLEKVGCIGIQTNKSNQDQATIIGFRREGFALYSYIIYNKPINQKDKDYIMNNDMYIPYNDKVIFEYAGGAIGPQHFPEGEKEEFLLKHKPW